MIPRITVIDHRQGMTAIPFNQLATAKQPQEVKSKTSQQLVYRQ